MLHTRLTVVIRMTARLQDVVKPNQIGLNISVRIRNGIPDACLCCKIDYDLRFIFVKNGINQFLIGNGTFNKSPCRFRMGVCHGLDLIESVFFYRYVVVGIHVVNPYDVDR